MGPGDDIMTDAYDALRKFVQDNAPDEGTRNALWSDLDDVREEGWRDGYAEGYIYGSRW